MSSPGSNGRRRPGHDPLDAGWLSEQLIRPGSLWQRIDVVAETASTNSDLAARARSGEPTGAVLITDHQYAGRGRRGRAWNAPAGTAVTLSVLVAPHDVAEARWGWLPLLAGLAVVEGLRRLADVPLALKWPNDVLIGQRKVCGILAERVDRARGGPAVVLGFGINVGLAEADLPVPTATSLAIAAPGAVPSRNRVIAAVLAAFELIFTSWQAEDDDTAFAAAYVARCSTIGRRVRVLLADGGQLEGVAEAVDAGGLLVVRTAEGRRVVAAGDVTHLRPAP